MAKWETNKDNKNRVIDVSHMFVKDKKIRVIVEDDQFNVFSKPKITVENIETGLKPKIEGSKLFEKKKYSPMK